MWKLMAYDSFKTSAYCEVHHECQVQSKTGDGQPVTCIPLILKRSRPKPLNRAEHFLYLHKEG